MAAHRYPQNQNAAAANGHAHRPQALLQHPRESARLSYRDLPQEAMDPPPENHMPGNHSATLHRAYTGPKELLTVLPSATVQMPSPIWLVREQEPEQAYVLMNKPPIEMTHRHPRWGCVFFGMVYPRVGETTFQAPLMHPECVAIKRLDKQVVHRYLALGGPENPYKEVARMEELGDNEHVLQCTEFLEDDNYLYIVTPKACEEGTLKDVIAWGDTDHIMEPKRIHQIFCKMLQILGYLEKRGINHRDWSPDNLLFLTPNNLVVFDLAMSLKIPVNEATGTRSLITPQGPHGTFPCMAPEVFANQVYDGVAADLWGASVILYYLLTNQLLYREPTLNDISYHYFVDAKGLSSQPMNDRTIDMMVTLGRLAPTDGRYADMRDRLLQQATAHRNMSEDEVSLLERLLAVDPAQRCSLAEAMESSFVQEG